MHSILWNPNVRHHVNNSLTPDPILSQMVSFYKVLHISALQNSRLPSGGLSA